MRSLLALVAVSALLASPGFGSGVLQACGAKFLVATRAARFQKMQRAARPGHIVVYQHSDNPKEKAADVKEFTDALSGLLTKVGHTVTVAPSEDALREATRSNDVDVVVMELDTARRLRSGLSLSPRVAMLPMAEYLTRTETAQAKEEFGQVLRLPAKESQVLSTVQDSIHRN